MMDVEVDATVPLRTGAEMPSIGFGTGALEPGDVTKDCVMAALQAGYRLIDTAQNYGNEYSVGQAIIESAVPRDHVLVTTKLDNDAQGYDQALRAFDESCEQLGLEYVDLYLMHWPVTGKRLETWKALEKILASGRAKAIGVSNFTPRHLKELLDVCNEIPAVNQIEFHPFIYKDQLETLQFCRDNDIVVEGYSSLANGRRFEDPTIAKLAQKYNQTSAQIFLRWAMQRGVVPLARSGNPERIVQNFDAQYFQINREDMLAIDALSNGDRIFPDPENMA